MSNPLPVSESPQEVERTYLEAVVEAQIEEMARDERVILMGEDLPVYGGGKIFERFDEKRIWSTPISEGSFTGVAVGAAITGLRPIVDLGIASFVYLAADQIINQASKLRYMTGAQCSVPITIRTTMYYGASLAAQHSDRSYPLFLNVPGLKIVSPTTPADVKALLKAAIRDDDPVIVFEDCRLWATKGLVSTDPDKLCPIGKAAIRQSGSDVTIVGIAGAMKVVLEAARVLSDEGISVEIIDPRTLKPLDAATILESVVKTGRLVLVENAHAVAGLSAEIAAVVAEDALDCLKKPIVRLSAPDIHVPFSTALERDFYPHRDQIVEAVKRML